MTLRARMSTIAAAAVAFAVIAVAVTAWLMTRSALMNEVDRQLQEQTPVVVAGGSVISGDEVPPPPGAGDPQFVGIVGGYLVQAVPTIRQELDVNGHLINAFPDAGSDVPISAETYELLGSGSDEAVLSSTSGGGVDYRNISLPNPWGGVTQISRSLDDVEDTLDQLAMFLTFGAIAGVALAGAAGWWVSRAGLRPVDQLTDTAEQVAHSKDLSHRIPVSGRDEIARLGRSINRMLEELDTARRQQRQLVEDAGHELRTPLATLRNDIGLLLRAEKHDDKTLDPADRAELLASVEAEVAALSGMLSEVVELARGDADEEPIDEVDLRDLIDHAVERTRRVNPDVTLSVRGPSIRTSVRPAAFERAISNIVRNALQVTPPGRKVDVTLTEAGKTAVIQVADEGPGIAHDDLPRIFDRFYRGHGSRERQGSGLGLAIVQQAVDRHGGSVEAANRPGIGARLTVRLPLLQEQASANS
ncbi:MAG TPA: HAMP domain-containing sensor histidine kinase [Jiangellaceae bacterium]